MLEDFPTPTAEVVEKAIEAWNAAHPNTEAEEGAVQ